MTELTILGKRVRNPCRFDNDTIKVEMFFQGAWYGFGAGRNDSTDYGRAIFSHYNRQTIPTCPGVNVVTSDDVAEEMNLRLSQGLFVDATRFRANADTITRLTMFKDNFAASSEDHEGITFTTAAGMTVMFQSAEEINNVLKKLSAYSAAVMAEATRLAALDPIPRDFRTSGNWPDPGTGAIPAEPEVNRSGFETDDDDDDDSGGSGSGSSGSGGTTS